MRIFCGLLFALLSLASFASAAEGKLASPELKTHVFDVGPSFITRLAGVIGLERGESADSSAGGRTLPPRWGPKDALQAMGVSFGEGSNCIYQASPGTLTVTNTEEQLGLIEVYLSLLDDQRERQLSVLFELIEVDHAAFSDWLFDHRIDTDGTPLRRWAQGQIRKGAAAVIETTAISCRSGNRARTTSGRESMHPTSYAPPEIPNKVGLSGGAEAPVAGVVPGAFDTRHVGATLEVDAVLGGDNVIIDLNLAAEVVRVDGDVVWANDEVESRFRARMPIFFEMGINTMITLKDGAYGFLGTMRPKESRVESVEEPIYLAFVRADVGVLPWPKAPANVPYEEGAGK